MLMFQSFSRAVQIGGHRTATVDGSERRSWIETADRVQRLQTALGTLGIGAGDRVAVLAQNCARYMEIYFASFAAGVVIVPLNTRWSRDELIHGLTDSGASLLFVDDHFIELAGELRGDAPALRQLVRISPDTGKAAAGIAAEAEAYEDLIENNAPAQPQIIAYDALAMINYTGGTTGRSKGVMLSHLALWTSALAFGHDIAGLAEEKTVTLNVMPLFHIGGIETVFSTVLGGGCNIFLPVFEPQKVLRTLQAEKVTHTQFVPTMMRVLLDQPNLQSFDLSSLEVMVYGAAPMSQAQIQETMQKFPGVKLQQGYGQTELAPYISTLKSAAHITEGPQSARLRSAGKAAICCEVIIADPDGKEVARREMGEILVRGPNMMLGYWGRPEETASAIVNGWVRTGDAGYMDEEGFIFIIDRLKDMIVSGGENIYSSEVENALASHPAVAIGLVIGIPHERWGETVHAIIQLRDGHSATAEDIIEHCRKFIAGYKVPRSVEFRSEPFPVSGAGKLLKRELRKPYWQGRGSTLV